MNYKNCILCAGSGIKADGTECYHEELHVDSYSDAPSNLKIPTEYKSKFNAGIIEREFGEVNGLMMQQLYNSIVKKQLKRNILLCGGPSTGKHVLAYSATRELYAQGVSVQPIRDLYEIEEDLKAWKKDDSIRDIYKVPYAFIVIPTYLPNRWVQIVGTVLERRNRFNTKATIFIYGDRYSALEGMDKFGGMSRLVGTGSKNSVELKEIT